jgi:hypothetical protein
MSGVIGTPIKPGQVLNPKGINQYTYRAEAEKHLAQWCKTHGRELIDKLLDEAKRGNDRMMKLALDRILPAVKEVDLRVTEEREPVVVPTTDERMGAVAELLQGTLH